MRNLFLSAIYKFMSAVPIYHSHFEGTRSLKKAKRAIT